jgi:hypothetical protein
MGMDDERADPAEVEALPLPERATAYLAAQQRLEHRLELPRP